MTAGPNNWPPAFTIAEIRAVCGPWSHQRLMRVLDRHGIVDRKRKPYLVSEDKLREHFPTIWDRLYSVRVLGHDLGAG